MLDEIKQKSCTPEFKVELCLRTHHVFLIHKKNFPNSFLKGLEIMTNQ